MNLPFPIKRVVVLLTDATDRIVIELEGPTPFPNMKDPLFVRIDAQYDYGAEWVRTNLPGIEFEVINTRVKLR